MDPTENDNKRLYKQPQSLPGEGPFSIPPGYRVQGLDMPEEGFVPLLCSTCGVILAPHEVKLDIGDGDELLCDACLGLSN